MPMPPYEPIEQDDLKDIPTSPPADVDLDHGGSILDNMQSGSGMDYPTEYVQPAPKQRRNRRKSTILEQLTSSDPEKGGFFWWFFKHPITRVSTCMFVTVTNLYVYWGDPGSFSNALSYGTFIGDLYHGWLQPDTPNFLIMRWSLMVINTVLGIWFGLLIHRHILRDWCRLVLFGYDNHRNPNRDPLASQDGAWFVVLCLVCVQWFVGLKLYAAALAACGVEQRHIPDSSMYGWTFASYNLFLAGLLTFFGDWWTMGAVVDQMLQTVDEKGVFGSGYKAYAKPLDDDPAGCCTHLQACSRRAFRNAAAWWGGHRITFTRIYLVSGWTVVLGYMLIYFYQMTLILEAPGQTGMKLGAMPWPMEWSDEYMRMLAGSLVATANLAIVAQDWDFPNFSDTQNMKVMAFDFSNIKIKLPMWCMKNMMPFFTRFGKALHLEDMGGPIYISGKWINYFGILFGLVFDWAYWFMTALCFRPCDYAHLWDPATGYMYAMTNYFEQQEHAGAASAKDCPWFTDNPLQSNYFNRSHVEWDSPNVILLEVGVFTGAYTIDENNAYIFNTPGATRMWLMCIPPVVAWVGLAWLVFTHEKVTCFNYHKVIEWHDMHGGGDGSGPGYDPDDIDNIPSGGEVDHEDPWGQVDHEEDLDQFDEDTRALKVEQRRRANSIEDHMDAEMERHVERARAMKLKRERTRGNSFWSTRSGASRASRTVVDKDVPRGGETADV